MTFDSQHSFVKDAVDRIIDEGNSLLLFQLAKRTRRSSVSSSIQRSSVFSTTQSTFSPVSQSMASMNVIGMTATSHFTRKVLQVTKNEDIFEMDAGIEMIEMRNGMCSAPDIKRWNVSVYSGLVELFIGDDCLQYVKELKLNRLASLEKVEVGASCYSQFSGGRFEVNACKKLQSVVIGENSCVNWTSFTMKNCAVEEVSIGDGCFVKCDSIVFEGGRCGAK